MVIVVDVLRWALGALVLAFLLYVPGAVVLNSVASRTGAGTRPPFWDAGEWLYSAVLVSVLVTGLAGFLLAEAGLFRWWLVLAVVAVFSLAAALTVGEVGAGRGRQWRAVLSLLRPAVRFLPYPEGGARARWPRLHGIAVGLVVLMAVGLFSRPAEMIRGANDSGAYINAGVALSRSGSLVQRDMLMRQLDNDKGEVAQLLQGLNPDRYTLSRLRMPAFYVLDKPAAAVLPQHYALFPVWVGLMHSLFGIWGALYANPLLALVLVLSVYYFARRATSPGAGLLTLTLLVLCPVMIWFARYPVSEVLTGLLAFGALYAFLRMMTMRREWLLPPSGPAGKGDPAEPAGEDGYLSARQAWASLWGLVAGVALGELALARPDFIFYLVPVLAYVLYWRLARRWRPEYTWFVGGLAVMLAVWGVYFAFFSFAYTLDLYHNVIQQVRRAWGLLLPALYVGVLVLVLIDRLHMRLRPLWVRAEGWARRYRWAWAGTLMAAVGLYVVYYYAIAPWQANIRYDDAGHLIPQQVQTTWASYIGAPVDQGERYNLLRVGWYLSPLGMVLGMVGLLRWIWGRLNAATGLFLGVLMVTGFVFIQETFTQAHYIYTMRRYVPVILPALIMGVAWACQFFWSRARFRVMGVGLGGALALAMALFFVYTSRVIVSNVELAGAVQQVTSFAARFPARSVLLFSNERDEPYVVATPLQYIFGLECFVVNPTEYTKVDNEVLEGVVRRWQSQGYQVWVVMGANGGKLYFPHLSLKEEWQWAFDVPEYEQLYYHKPTNMSRSYLPWGVYSVHDAVQSPYPTLPFNLDIGNMDYKWLVAGFYTQEQAPGDPSPWRWTGEHAILRLPWPTQTGGRTSQAVTLTLRLRPETPRPGQPPLRASPLTVSLSVGDTPVGQVVVPPGSGFADYTLRVPAGIPMTTDSAESGTALLHIQAPTWSPQEAGVSYDSRALGVQLDSVWVGP